MKRGAKLLALALAAICLTALIPEGLSARAEDAPTPAWTNLPGLIIPSPRVTDAPTAAITPEATLTPPPASEATATDLPEATATPVVTASPTPMPKAEDITFECALNGYWGDKTPGDMRDRRYRSYWKSARKSGVCSLVITAPEDKVIGGILIQWRTWPLAVAIQVQEENGEWVTVTDCDGDFAAQYIPIPSLKEFRVISRDDNGWTQLQICEITIVTPGELPEDFQVWRKPPEKVDMMLVEGHPDDEVLWFGGLLPTYAGEQGKDVLVVNGAFNNYVRRLELLDSLWTCGIDIYPIIMNYIDVVSWNKNQVYNKWGGQEKVIGDIVSLYRQYKPEVVVLHAEGGESGHGAHQVLSDAGRNAVSLAADAEAYPQSAELYGLWQVKKAYVHLWPENQLFMDWHVPLMRFGGLDSMEVATMAFQKHVSQQGRKYSMKDGGDTDCSLFGLYYSNVGEDVEKNDLFENLPGDGE